MTAIVLASELLFGLLFVTTMISYVRRRDPVRRDVMLIVASVAALFAVVRAGLVAGELPDPVTGAALMLLFAQPLFTLRLASRFAPIPRVVGIVAGIAFAVTAAPFLVVPVERIGALAAVAVAVFGVTHVVAAVHLARHAARRVGSARVRLGAAAAAGAVMALALGLSLAATAVPAARDVGRLLALGSAVLYILAFMPPAWLRNVWSAVATYEFMEALIGTNEADNAAGVWARTAAIARRTTGAVAASVVAGEPVRTLAFDHDARGLEAAPVLESVPTSAYDHRRLSALDGPLGAAADRLGAPYVSVIPFTELGDEPGALVLFHQRPSLFEADDRQIVAPLVARATLFAQRSEALHEQAALADQLAVTVEALERASQAKSDFLASMSHELRTPLSAIIGFSALMRDEPREGDRRSVPDEWIEHVHRSGQHLLALINDVLDLTKIEAGRIELEHETFDLAAQLTESVEGLRPLAKRKNLLVEVDAEAGSIVADRGRLRQIVYNLLSNAIKFTPDGGRISVVARWSDDDARIAVVDSGVGIAPEDLGRIFDEFRQVGDLKGREAGTGLGLALSRRLAEAHGGSIEVSSRLDVGSRFEVILPGSRAERPPAPASTGSEVLPDRTSMTILVIEDDPGAVRLLRAYLEGEGYDVVVATDGEAGIAAARASSPAAIILDVLLPGIDGWEVLRQLKSDAGLRDIPVVVATVVDERNIAMRLGAVDYFLKPIVPEALLTRLAQYTFTSMARERVVGVLAIDDDPAALDLIAGTLRPAGFVVRSAASGREGVAMALDDPPEVVICDLVMPDLDGFEVVDRLRANAATRDAAILILTAHDLSASDRERLNGKVAAILPKGVDPRHALDTWLERAAAAFVQRSARTPRPATRPVPARASPS